MRRGRSVSSSFAPFSVQTGNITSIRIGPQAEDTSAGENNILPNFLVFLSKVFYRARSFYQHQHENFLTKLFVSDLNLKNFPSVFNIAYFNTKNKQSFHYYLIFRHLW